MNSNILITGVPGVGKTTVITKLVDLCRDLSPRGFYTAELREGGVRTGFELRDLDGTTITLAHVSFSVGPRVGKYRVDLDGFNRYLERCDLTGDDGGVVILDEIGKMECFSRRFRSLICHLLDSETPVIATIAKRGGEFITGIKKRSDSELIEVTRANRDNLPRLIISKLLS
jgi:nucleoside-triphosphatase